jgi:hypothetical protein
MSNNTNNNNNSNGTKLCPVFEYSPYQQQKASNGKEHNHGGEVAAERITNVCNSGKCSVIKPNGETIKIDHAPKLKEKVDGYSVHGGVKVNGHITYH